MEESQFRVYQDAPAPGRDASLREYTSQAGGEIMSQAGQLGAIWAYVDQHAEAMLDQLKTLVRQPSISAQDVGVRECAELLAGMMRADGIETQILLTAGQPVIVGKGDAVSGAPTA